MSCLVKKSNICSPESTVSSLLASGNFKSGHDSLSHSSIQYKDKWYSSASQALEAYIKDFNLSLSSSDVRTGKIEILPRAPENFKSSKDNFESKSDDTEKLIQKARRALEPSAKQSTSLLKNDGSPSTVDVLEAERLWDNVPIGLKSPVPVSCVEENSPPNPKARMVNNFLEDCLHNDQQESTFSGGNHHGPVEALKLMLFNLQAVQHSFHKNKSDRPKEESPKVSNEDENIKLIDCDMIPVARSLQRALHHLSRLKGLVDDTGGREESTESLKT
ncbi:lung adenoma susceptibility protein 2 isoform X2 [Thamnophis elegans]|uniref:lung adenoma susceptibility protein 2 isoform X2 n=1 Tax=Thamnophis elegans TaxID=35005 RepID=UPI001377B430|nr:lung adenoma susceptibility protein 2 isoform X2 [Thamnophis elegans]